MEVKGFTKSDYAYNPDNQKWTSGYIFISYGDNAISWTSKLQEYIALLTTEAKYIVVSKAMKEAIWLHSLSANFSTTSWINHLAPILCCDS